MHDFTYFTWLSFARVWGKKIAHARGLNSWLTNCCSYESTRWIKNIVRSLTDCRVHLINTKRCVLNTHHHTDRTLADMFLLSTRMHYESRNGIKPFEGHCICENPLLLRISHLKTVHIVDNNGMERCCYFSVVIQFGNDFYWVDILQTWNAVFLCASLKKLDFSFTVLSCLPEMRDAHLNFNGLIACKWINGCDSSCRCQW